MAVSQITDPTAASFEIELASDRMMASLRTPKNCGKLTREPILQALRKEQVAITPAVEANVDKICARETSSKQSELLVLAEGIPPLHAIPPSVEAIPQGEPEGFGRERSTIPAVIEGAVIGRVIAAIPGKDGLNIHDQPVPHRQVSDEIPLGNNVALSPDRKSVIAKIPGLLQMKRGRISVETALEVSGNLDFSTGNVNFVGSVMIRGNVADLFKVIATEDIYVGGAVEAADIHGGNNVEVHSGICCRDKGHVIAGNDLRAKFISNTTVEAGNNVVVNAEIANSRVMCKGKLQVEVGAIYTSHISAAGGVVAGSLGSPAYAKTLIECGIDAALRRDATEKMPEIQASIRRVNKVREVIGPILQQQKNLTANQKEKATEMLYEADQLQQQADASMKEIAADYEHFAEISKTADIFITGTVYPGVTIRFPEVETTIRMPIKGPVRIQCRDVQGKRTIVAINENTKATQQLELRCVEDEVMEELVKTLEEGKLLHDKGHAPTPESQKAPIAA